MFSIQLTQVGKKYNREWIFRDVVLQFNAGKAYAVLGPNGSGKSTFLQVLAGIIIPSEGTIAYTAADAPIIAEDVFAHISIATPYMELVEEYTFPELIDFQRHFKPFASGISTNEIIAISGLQQANNKQIRYFSSGMKQRARLTLAILAQCPVLLLDEPTSNLDRAAILWYQEMMKTHTKNKLVIVCSNHIQDEIGFCDTQIDLLQYK